MDSTYTLNRRKFLGTTTTVLAGLTWGAPQALRAQGANNRVRLGIMGTNGRGSDLAQGFAKLEAVEIGAICDVDERAIAKGVKAAGGGQGRAPKTFRDVRRLLEETDLDALVIAAPDHWHGPATILACQAGKHVYVEKPASHNPQEGEWMIAVARKHRRVVQVGTQRRSFPQIQEAISALRAGSLGPIRFARGWYNNTRGTIGGGQPAAVPNWLDWNLWQGPAPQKPYRDNYVHYHWHWFWHWGTGELGNNGIHALDLCRWGLGVTAPRRVTCGGGRYHFTDDQETPDTQVATFDFGDRAIAWEGRSCQRHGYEGSMFGAAFYGEGGTLVVDGSSYRVYDTADKELRHITGPSSDAPHLQNFIDCVRSSGRPNADIQEGHLSTLLCHLGNIAWRTHHTLECDPVTGRILKDSAAARLWQRKYQRGWEPKVSAS